MNIPLNIGRYQIIRELAKGGMGQVYLARMQGPGGFEKRVVVKRIHAHLAGDPKFTEMFVREAKLLARLYQKNIVQVIDFGESDEGLFLAMEYVEGHNLTQIFKRLRGFNRAMPVRLVLYIGIELCAALDFAHRFHDPDSPEAGVVHRDVSPQNVLISFAGEVKLTDFGIARVRGLQPESSDRPLQGKAAYMSPEQASGGPVDHRSDIFSLGIILFELLTGTRLYYRRHDRQVIELARRAEIPQLTDIDPRISEELNGIVLRALQKDPSLRYQSAREFANLLRALPEHQASLQPAADLGDLVSRLFRAEKQFTLGRPLSSKARTLARAIDPFDLVPQGRDEDEPGGEAEGSDARGEEEGSSPRQPPPRRCSARRILCAALLLLLAGLLWRSAPMLQGLVGGRSDRGALVVHSEIPFARVLLDDQPAGNIDADFQLTLRDLPVGKHVLQLEKEGYRSIPTEVEVVGQGDASCYLSATPLHRTLIVRATQPGDAVYLDGIKLGETAAPCGAGCYAYQLGDPPPGAHLLRVEAEPFPPFLQWITIEETEEPLIIDAHLASFAKSRSLIIEEVPPGSRILVDDEVALPRVERIPVVLELEAGDHTLKIEFPDSRRPPLVQNITMLSDQNLSLRLPANSTAP
jgi:serine/threonine protein kinase